VVHDYIRSELRPLAEISAEHAEDIFRLLQANASAELAAEGIDASAAQFVRDLDLRYSGQGYELRTPLDGLFADRLTDAALVAVRERFDARHAQLHGHAAKERPVEVVSYRLRARVPVPKYEPTEEAPTATGQTAIKGTRTISLAGMAIETTIYERDRLQVGALIAAPAIVEQFDATTLIPPGWGARVDGYRNLILART
jgi:N-methylhydantoinase A